MSQRRGKYRGKDHAPITMKQDHGDASLHSFNYLFDSIHPPESYTSSKAVQVVSSIHIAILNIMLIIGQYIILFGNYVWRYETKLFLVSMLLSIEKVAIELIFLIRGNISETAKNHIRQIVIIVVMLSCTLLPRYRCETIYDIIISISIILLVVFVSFRHDDEIDPSKSFYNNLFSIATIQFLTSSIYPLMYYLIINQYAGEDLLPAFLIGFILECLLAAQKVLFHSHLYANVYKYQGFWTCLPAKYKHSIEGRIEPWKPNHVYSFGSVVSYQDYCITGMGYLNNVTPFTPYLEFPFMCVFEKEKMHKTMMVVHVLITLFCCLQMVIQQFQLRFAILTVISVISLILMFPLHTMAFN